MQLCAPDAIQLGFVTKANGEPIAPTKNSSIDLTIGVILKKRPDGSVAEYDTACTLEPQETVYLISSEYLDIKGGHTAYVFLKNRLSQKGVLAFNTGIIDEGYKGCISTLVTNLSRNPVDLHAGTEFFRVVIHRFDCTDENSLTPQRHEFEIGKYTEYRKLDLFHFPKSFLDQERIKAEINQEVKSISTSSSLKNLSFVIGGVALLFAILTVFTPMIQGYFSIPTARETQAAYLEIAGLKSSQAQMEKEVSEYRRQEGELTNQLADYRERLRDSLLRIGELEKSFSELERKGESNSLGVGSAP